MLFANYNPQSWIKMYLSLSDKLGNFFLQKFEKWKNVIFEPMLCWDSPSSRLLGPLLLKNRGLEGSLFQRVLSENEKWEKLLVSKPKTVWHVEHQDYKIHQQVVRAYCSNLYTLLWPIFDHKTTMRKGGLQPLKRSAKRHLFSKKGNTRR